jgi:2-alkenal reductase
MYQQELKPKRKKNALHLTGLFLITILVSLGLAACAGASTPTAISQTTSASQTNAPSGTATTSWQNQSTTAPANNPTARTVPTVAPTVGLSQDQIESNTVAGVVKRVNPAVVTIYNKAKVSAVPSRQTPNNPDGSNGGGNYTQGVGSGVIINTDGYILTNAHVVEGEEGISVAFNDGAEIVDAKLIGLDTLGDIAVIKVEAKVPAIAPLGDSSKLQLGETVIAIGAALGNFRNSVSKGVVSGVNRTIPGDTSNLVFIQTDAAINSGNSGGPLLNLRGEVIGINTAVVRNTSAGGISRSGTASAEGLGFAIPSNTAKLLSDQLIKNGKVTRPYFGITYQMITPAIAGTQTSRLTVPKTEGAWISSIVAGGPSDKAGLRENDVITAVNGEQLNDNNPFSSMVLKFKPGDTVKATVQRGDRSLTLDVTLAERPANR